LYLTLPVTHSIAFELMKDSIYRYNVDQFFPQSLIALDKTTQTTQTASVHGNYKLQPKTHVIKSGESLSLIARKYKTTVSELAKLNKMNAQTTIHPGKKLLVGYTKIMLPNPKPVIPDSTKIALDAPKTATDTLLGNAQSDKIQQEKETLAKTYITYKVVQGDTLTSIVNQFKTVSITELRKINQLKEDDVLSVGQSLKIPVQ
jgi:LysM repeat protein